MGRKLYSYPYDLDFEQIDLDLSAHHLIYGEMDEVNRFNWTKKLEVAAGQATPSPSTAAGMPSSCRNSRRFSATPDASTISP